VLHDGAVVLVHFIAEQIENAVVHATTLAAIVPTGKALKCSAVA
jgi:hypothetical protein